MKNRKKRRKKNISGGFCMFVGFYFFLVGFFRCQPWNNPNNRYPWNFCNTGAFNHRISSTNYGNISVMKGQYVDLVSYPAHVSGFFGYTLRPDIRLQLLYFSHSGTADEANILPGPYIRIFRIYIQYWPEYPESGYLAPTVMFQSFWDSRRSQYPTRPMYPEPSQVPCAGSGFGWKKCCGSLSFWYGSDQN